jgi:hypothetical protein
LLGVVFIQLATKQHARAFINTDPRAGYNAAKGIEPYLEIFEKSIAASDSLSRSLFLLAKRMVQTDPTQRCTAECYDTVIKIIAAEQKQTEEEVKDWINDLLYAANKSSSDAAQRWAQCVQSQAAAASGGETVGDTNGAASASASDGNLSK